MSRLSESLAKRIMDSYGNNPQQLISVLLDIQKASGKNYVDRRYAVLAAKTLKIPLTRIYEVITFYGMFGVSPRGRYIVEVCRSAPCRFNGGKGTFALASGLLGVGEGETTADGVFTLESSSCFGACGEGMTLKINDAYFTRLNPAKMESLFKELKDGVELSEDAEFSEGDSGTRSFPEEAL
jgi:NADH-quinone oxidoreductase subunit E